MPVIDTGLIFAYFCPVTMKRIIYTGIILLLGLFVHGQETKVVNLIRAEEMTYNRQENENLRVCTGDVLFEVDSTYLFCDTAYLNDKTKDIDACGDVRIKMSDTLNLYGQELHYTGKTRIARISKDVRLVDNEMVLTTDSLVYDRNNTTASYTTGGKIEDTTNTLTSIEGYYNTKSKDLTFRDSVVIVNPDYTIYSDTTMYNTITKMVDFRGPSRVISEENTLYCENGWYDTKKDKSQMNRNAYLDNGEQTIFGDSIFYDRDIGFGKAVKDVRIRDAAKDVILTGQYAEYNEQKLYSFITDSARAILINKRDSLYLSSDTLWSYLDTTKQLKTIHAYYESRFFHEDIQGKSDSIKYAANDSLINMYTDPVLWSKGNQIVADTIKIQLKNKEIDNLELFDNCLIASYDTLDYYNQIKGKYMKAFFREGQLRKIYTEGNAETIYYVKDEDKSLIGVNMSVSSKMRIILEDNEFSWITYIENPEEILKPMKDMTKEDRFFKNFKWLDDIRPRGPNDVY
ncbi:MAG: hypothetical protein K9J27_02270 [Bacteroidales bacterium]|nr:hypothetical protein [Bacteroidales bacterium]MCF8332993.1 hypothetical protein [Bacteroidales bacterium]